MKNVFCSPLSYLLRKMPVAIEARRITSVTLTLLLLLAAVVPVLLHPGFVHAEDTFTRPDDPLSLPAGVGNSVAFSPYSSYIALAPTANPYVNIYQQSLPPAPTLTSPDNDATVAATSITFSWDAVSDATNYAVQVSTSPTFSSLFHYNYTKGATSFTYTDFPNNGTTYYWRARAYNADGWGNWSSSRNFVNGTPPVIPPLPPTLASPTNGATVEGTSITFSWNSVSGATNYAIQVSTSPTFSSLFHYNYTKGATSFTYTDFPDNGTTYYWRARAYNPAGWGSWSLIRSCVNGTVPPSAPILILPVNDATASGTSITFWWSPVSGATNYAVQVSTSSSFSPLFHYNYTSGATSFTYTDFPDNGTTYYWRARAYNPAGWGSWSSSRNFINGTVPPSAPILILPVNDATASGTSITFWWSPVSGATNYAVQVSTSPTFSSLFHYNYTKEATSFTYTDFPDNGTTYYWRARAYNPAGWGSWSSSRSLVNGTPPPAPPPAPALTSPDDTATVAGTSINFSWDAVSGATNYAVQVSTSPSFSPLFHYNYTSATSKTYTDFPDNGTTYYWRARAYNPAGWGSWSSSRSFVNGSP